MSQAQEVPAAKIGRPRVHAENDWRMHMRLPADLGVAFVALARRNRRSATQELAVAVEQHLARERASA